MDVNLFFGSQGRFLLVLRKSSDLNRFAQQISKIADLFQIIYIMFSIIDKC